MCWPESCRYSLNNTINLIKHLLLLKESAKLTKHQLDVKVISETKSVKIETSKGEGRLGDYW